MKINMVYRLFDLIRSDTIQLDAGGVRKFSTRPQGTYVCGSQAFIGPLFFRPFNVSSSYHGDAEVPRCWIVHKQTLPENRSLPAQAD